MMTNLEKALLNHCLENGYKWIARDATGEVWVYEKKPIYEERYGWNTESTTDESIELTSNRAPVLTEYPFARLYSTKCYKIKNLLRGDEL